MQNIYNKIIETKNSGKKAALCIITGTKGSTPRKTGSKMIVFEDKSIFDTIGGGSIELQVINDAVNVISANSPGKFSYNLEKDFDMHCGGYVEVYIEPILSTKKLFIFGAGHVGKAVAKFASQFGFNITVFDERPEIFNDLKIPNTSFVTNNYFKAIDEAHFDDNTYIVVTTPKHAYDEDITAICAKKPHAYLGMIGSEKKVATAKQKFLQEKYLTEKEIKKIDMPIGIKFNAQTPEEIAISIVAKLIDIKNSFE